MKNIYILLTKSSTWVSKIISLVTNDTYTHSAISFDEKLNKMYGFSRKYVYLPLPANIQRECINDNFHVVNNKMPCMLLKVSIEDNVYNDVKRCVQNVYMNKEEYDFNVLGLILCRLGIAKKRHNKYFCSQFVSETLEKYGVISLEKDPSIFRPNDFLNCKNLQIVFVGRLNELKEKIKENARL